MNENLIHNVSSKLDWWYEIKLMIELVIFYYLTQYLWNQTLIIIEIDTPK